MKNTKSDLKLDNEDTAAREIDKKSKEKDSNEKACSDNENLSDEEKNNRISSSSKTNCKV